MASFFLLLERRVPACGFRSGVAPRIRRERRIGKRRYTAILPCRVMPCLEGSPLMAMPAGLASADAAQTGEVYTAGLGPMAG